MDLSLSACHPVLQASELYADLLNSSSISNHIVNLLGGKHGMRIAPYVYISSHYLEYETYNKRKKRYGNQLSRLLYEIQEVNLYDEDDVINYVVPIYQSTLPHNFDKGTCGLIGVPIGSEDEESPQDHYVSYVYAKGVLHYFDSAIDEDYKETETYRILVEALTPQAIIVNKKTFETEGGVSESPYSYIAQNIFCHTWSLWFLYVFIVEGKCMRSIDRIAGKGPKADKVNLIRMKTFIFNIAVKRLKLCSLYDLGLFDSFRYIIEDDDPERVRAIIKYPQVSEHAALP